MVILSLQSTNGKLNHADTKSFSESEVKKIAWAEHTSLSHSKNKSLSQSKTNKIFCHLKSKDLPHPNNKDHDLVEAASNAQSEENLSQPKIVTLSHPEKSPAKTGNKNAPQPEKYPARPESRNIPELEKSPTHPGKKNISQMINKSLSLSELGGGEGAEPRHTFMYQVY